MTQLQTGELARKAIHYSSTLIPVLYYFYIGRNTVLIVLGILSGLILLLEILRMVSGNLYGFYLRLFGTILRPHEHYRRLTGASFVFIASFLSVLIFPKEVAVAAMLVAALADPTACLVGERWGTIRLLKAKSLQGWLAFLAAGWVGLAWLPDFDWHQKITFVLFASLVELFSGRLDDNLTVPLVTGGFILLWTNWLPFS